MVVTSPAPLDGRREGIDEPGADGPGSSRMTVVQPRDRLLAALVAASWGLSFPATALALAAVPALLLDPPIGLDS